MDKHSDISLGDHFDRFITQQITEGRFDSAHEVLKAGLRVLEQQQVKMDALRYALKEGEQSGHTDYALDSLIAELDQENQP